MNLEKRTYTSSNTYSFLGILKASVRGYANSFHLARQLAKRDIKAQYRQSVFGIFWAIAPIFINSLIWIFLQQTGTVNVATTAIPYPVFVLIGTTLWSIIGECINLPIQSINSNKGIVTKINFDKEALITLGLIKFFFNFLIKLALIVLFLVYFKIAINPAILLFLPLLLLSVVFFISIGILITPIGVLYNDVSKMIPIALQFLMYVTPVVYAIPNDGLMRTIMIFNPLTYMLTDLRNILTGLQLENPVFWIGLIVGTALLSMLAMIVYRVAMPIITERMSA